jgi:hypothetical protein
MKRYAYESPPGWLQRPFPAPQQGVYLTAPPGTPRASILLMDAIAPRGSVAEQLEEVVSQGCTDAAELLERLAAQPLPSSGGLPGMVAVVRLRVVHEGQERAEGRAFALFEGHGERLPVIFMGDSNALPYHKAAVNQVLGSIRSHLPDAEALY